MSTLAVELHPQAHNVKCTDVAIFVDLLDGEGIHWPELDEDLSVAGLLAGTHS